MKKTNISALQYGYGVEGLGFYYISVFTDFPKVKEDDTTAVVHVLEGSFTAEMLAVELENLLPGKTKWEIEEKGKDTFSTNFPSSDWLATIVNWGTMDTKTVQGKIKLEKSVEDDTINMKLKRCGCSSRDDQGA